MTAKKEPKPFALRGDFLFEATSIDNAFDVLARHFRRLKNGEPSDLIVDGELHVKPAEDMGDMVSFWEVAVETITLQPEPSIVQPGVRDNFHVNCKDIELSVKGRLNAGWTLASTVPGEKVTYLVYTKECKKAIDYKRWNDIKGDCDNPDLPPEDPRQPWWKSATPNAPIRIEEIKTGKLFNLRKVQEGINGVAEIQPVGKKLVESIGMTTLTVRYRPVK